MNRLGTRSTALVLPLLGLALLAPAGCVAGNSTRVEKPTTGKELIDLKAALDQGAISQVEYDTQKAKLLGSGGSEVVQVRIVENDD